jgi:predicted XRE-type DNA-binding protein
MKRLKEIEKAKIKILYDTGAIDQNELSKVFGVCQPRISMIVGRRRAKRNLNIMSLLASK